MLTSQSIIDSVSDVLAQSDRLKVTYDPPADGPRDGRFIDLDRSSLHPDIVNWLRQELPDGLFTHQHAAVEQVLRGRHTVVSTRTSSGKSLIFGLPALHHLADDPKATSLLLYPQKALANDQLLKLRSQIADIPALEKLQTWRPELIGRYDGSVPTEQRKRVRDQVQVLLTNPDMLHLGILQHHETSWARFFANLKLVAIDECHEYRGIFGTNVAYVLRRLRQICELHGSCPTFVATSATIADPQSHLKRLVGCDFETVGVDQDGSRQGRRKFWLVRSPDHYYDSARRLCNSLVDAGLNVLCFCPSRTAAERLLSKLRGSNGELPEHTAVYRSGLRADEREGIEDGLRDGSKRLVFSTSALELGIDIGCLDVVVCVGLPNSMMSLWQRAGRVARSGREGAVILIPGESPLDSYYAQHPSELFSSTVESLALNLSNQRVSVQHYACAIQESGGGEAGLNFEILGEQVAQLQSLRNSGQLQHEVLYSSEPHAEISLRNTGEFNYEILCDGQSVGDLGSFHLLREAPRNAIYRHNGKTYRVKDVIRGRRIVRVHPERTRNETTSYIQKNIRQKLPVRVRQYSQLTVSVSRLEIIERLVSVTEKDASGKTVKTHPATGMPITTLPTEGVCIVLSHDLTTRMQSSIHCKLEMALGSVDRLMANLFPTVHGPCDSQDYSSGCDRTGTGELALYLYDNVYDGVSLTQLAFDRLPELLDKVRERIESCECPDDVGCVRCVANPQQEKPSSKSAALRIVEMLQEILQIEQPATTEFDWAVGDLLSAQAIVNCPTCKAQVAGHSKFCSNCGHKMEEMIHATA